MFQKETQFCILPNEVICCIFDFLTAFDILRAFSTLKRRYADLVRCYVKKINLTDNWQWDYHQLKWISNTIHTLKADERHIYFLSHFRFNQLHSLSLINIENWDSVVFSTKLKSLCLWFDSDIRYYRVEGIIPRTVCSFSTNAVMKINAFHINLSYLHICVCSIVQLLAILGRTPHVQHLHVTFINLFGEARVDKYYHSDLEILISEFHRLTDLRRLSIMTTHVDDVRHRYISSRTNECLPFDQIVLFIDQCCPSKMILKQVALKLDHIIPYQNLWPTFVRYKNTFDQFDFYVSIIIKDEISNTNVMPKSIDHFGFHVEGIDGIHPQGRFVHVYSLPFAFDKLHGFHSCSDLSDPSLFSSVRHLYFTRINLTRPIAFRSLTIYMPRLISIDCILTFNNANNIRVSYTTDHKDIFSHVHSLYFALKCENFYRGHHDLLPWLLDRMPRLYNLTTTDEHLSYALRYAQHPLPPIKLIDLRQSYWVPLDSLSQYLPYLTTVFFSRLTMNEEKLSQFLASLFIETPSLSFVSYGISLRGSRNQTSYEQIAQNAFARMHKMYDCLRGHLNLAFRDGTVQISRTTCSLETSFVVDTRKCCTLL